MANQLYPVLPRIVDTNIDASPGAKLTFYVSGTTTPLTVFTTDALDVAHPSPLLANADGSLPAIWVESGAAKVVVTDADDASMFTIDPVVSTSPGGFTAADIAFSPTVDLPYTDAQAAIEGAAAASASGFGTYGLGITGNATLLANIDATNIGAGAYRFDNTTTGTFPTGVAAADTGLVEHWRQASGTAMQFLYHATTDRIFHRRMASSSWGAWRENITANQGATEGDVLYRGASAWTRLAKGTAGQVLKINSGATAPEWGSSAEDIIHALASAHAGADVTTAQDLFPMDVTLDASSIYQYELVFSQLKTAGATAHRIRYLYGGTVGISSMQRNFYMSWDASSTAATTLAWNGIYTSAAEQEFTANIAFANVTTWMQERGTVITSTGGTFIPQYRLTVAPGGAYSTRAGSYFRLRKLGASGSNIAIGAWA